VPSEGTPHSIEAALDAHHARHAVHNAQGTRSFEQCDHWRAPKLREEGAIRIGRRVAFSANSGLTKCMCQAFGTQTRRGRILRFGCGIVARQSVCSKMDREGERDLRRCISWIEQCRDTPAARHGGMAPPSRTCWATKWPTKVACTRLIFFGAVLPLCVGPSEVAQ
jgi:hypothetical protein